LLSKSKDKHSVILQGCVSITHTLRDTLKST